MRRVLSLSTLYPNAADPRFGTFVARSLEALAARGDWQVTLLNPIGLPPVALGRYRALAQEAVGGVEHGVEVHRPVFRMIPRFGGLAYGPHLRAQQIHLPPEAIGNVPLEILAQPDERLGDLLHRNVRCLWRSGWVERPPLGSGGESFAAGIERALALHDFADGVIPKRICARHIPRRLAPLVAGLPAAFTSAHQPFNARLQTLDGPVQRVE